MRQRKGLSKQQLADMGFRQTFAMLTFRAATHKDAKRYDRNKARNEMRRQLRDN
jgi:hypothetical protein